MKLIQICFTYSQRLKIDERELAFSENYELETLFETLNFSEYCEFLVRYAYKCDMFLPKNLK